MAKDTSTEIKSQKIEIEVIIPDELPVIYSNYAGFFASNTDCLIDFGLRDNLGKAKIMTRVIMSPEQTRVFAEKLNGLLDAINKKNEQQ
ncbi:MAG: DUF3467 domain-containing protein [Candidatus Neomarinimicrobiota bacterium]